MHHCTSKKNGAYYTPSHLADYLVKPLIKRPCIKVFDPAYGEGALLLATEKIAKIKNYSVSLFGCDISPINGSLRHLPQGNFQNTDFFDFNVSREFDVILMNPPFIKYHLLNKKKIPKYRKGIDASLNIKRTSDLWVYFLIRSLHFLKPNGSIGAILPWSFAQADYSTNLRKYLAENFGSIRVLTLTKNYFSNTYTKVLLLWLTGYGKKNYEIKSGITSEFNRKVKFNDLTNAEFETINFNVISEFGGCSIIKRFTKNHKFSNLENFANVKIGLVTGNNEYFILNDEQISNNGFSSRNVIPVLNSSKQFNGLNFNGHTSSNYLLKITNNQAFRSYIRKGKNLKVNLTAHSLSRQPWYKVQVGRIPDAFFPYRIRDVPYIAINNSHIQCTNSIHRIYFKKLSENQKKWIQLSLLSAPGQLSIELNSKSYSGGVLKVEPSSLKKTIVYSSNKKVSIRVYEKISLLLSQSKKMQAVEMATHYLSKKLSISVRLINKTIKLLALIKNIRTQTK